MVLQYFNISSIEHKPFFTEHTVQYLQIFILAFRRAHHFYCFYLLIDLGIGEQKVI